MDTVRSHIEGHYHALLFGGNGKAQELTRLPEEEEEAPAPPLGWDRL
jgi:hypothetical protein